MDEFSKNDDLKQFSTNQILKTFNDENFENNDLTNIYNNFSEDINSDISLQNNTETDMDTDTDNNIINNAAPEKINFEDSNTTNCLALTIKEEHKLVAVKNVFIHSLKVTWKVIVSTIALHILKIFF